MKRNFSPTRLLLPLILSSVLASCGNKAEPVAPPVTAPGPPTLTRAEAEAQIKAVQDNKGIPESSKTSIISEIQAKVKP